MQLLVTVYYVTVTVVVVVVVVVVVAAAVVVAAIRADCQPREAWHPLHRLVLAVSMDYPATPTQGKHIQRDRCCLTEERITRRRRGQIKCAYSVVYAASRMVSSI